MATKMTKKAQAILCKLAGMDSILDKMPRKIRTGLIAAAVTGTMASAKAQHVPKGQWLQAMEHNPTVSRIVGDKWEGKHQMWGDVKFRLATSPAEADSVKRVSQTKQGPVIENVTLLRKVRERAVSEPSKKIIGAGGHT